MHQHDDRDQPQYRAARLHRALAEDPRTNELGIQVTLRGDDVYLSGTVATAHRKAELDRVLGELEPDAVVHNQVRVAEAAEPRRPEDIS